MFKDEAFFLLLAGMLAYRALDLAANKRKLSQSLLQAERLLACPKVSLPLLAWFRPKKIDFNLHRLRRVLRWKGWAFWIDQDFEALSMSLLLAVFAWTGFRLIPGIDHLRQHVWQHRPAVSPRDNATLVVANIAVAFVVSSLGLFIESFKNQLEGIPRT